MTHGSWSHPAVIGDQWEDCSAGGGCSPIPGATRTTYTVSRGDIGSSLQVLETETAGDGSTNSARSAATAMIRTSSSVVVGSSMTEPAVNQPVTLSALISAPAPARPTGSLTFLNGTAAIPGCAEEPVAASGQTASVLCRTSLAAPEADVSAVFTADPGSAARGSTSPVLTIAVSRAPTVVRLGVPRRVTVGRTAYTATIEVPAGFAAAPVAPAGTVQFLDGTRVIRGCARQRVIGLSATCLTLHPTPGGHLIRARYRGDLNYAPAMSAPAPQTVAPVGGVVAAQLRWTFYFTPSATRVVELVLAGAPYGSSVVLGCGGAGCPFSALTRIIAPPPECRGAPAGRCVTAGSTDLGPSFGGALLGAGAQISVTVQRAGDAGKSYIFTMRAGREPSVAITCSAAGSSSPGAACPPR